MTASAMAAGAGPGSSAMRWAAWSRPPTETAARALMSRTTAGAAAREAARARRCAVSSSSLAEDDRADGLEPGSPQAGDRDVRVALEQRQVGVELVEPAVDERRAEDVDHVEEAVEQEQVVVAVLDVGHASRVARHALGRVSEPVASRPAPGAGQRPRATAASSAGCICERRRDPPRSPAPTKMVANAASSTSQSSSMPSCTADGEATLPPRRWSQTVPTIPATAARPSPAAPPRSNARAREVDDPAAPTASPSPTRTTPGPRPARRRRRAGRRAASGRRSASRRRCARPTSSRARRAPATGGVDRDPAPASRGRRGCRGGGGRRDR